MIEEIEVAKIKRRQMDLLLEVSRMGERAFLTGRTLRENPFRTNPPSWEYRLLAHTWEEGWYLGCSFDVSRMLYGDGVSVGQTYKDHGLSYRPGFVYLLSSPETRFCKIGRSRDLGPRLKRLSTLPPFEYDVTHYFRADDCHRAEAALHAHFEKCRKRGEWFALQPDDIAWIQSIVVHKYSRFYFHSDFLPVPMEHYAPEVQEIEFIVKGDPPC